MNAGLWFRILLLQFRMVEPPAKVRPLIRDLKVNQKPKYRESYGTEPPLVGREDCTSEYGFQSFRTCRESQGSLS
jgi:hypothetical protein